MTWIQSLFLSFCLLLPSVSLAAGSGDAPASGPALETEGGTRSETAAVPADSSEDVPEPETVPEEDALLLDGLPIDDEIVVLEEFGVETDPIRPPALVGSEVFFETMRDLSLQAELPVGYDPSATHEQIDTFGLAGDITEGPEHGELRFPDPLSTAFIYLPDGGFVGEDEFRFVPFTYHRPEFRDSGMVLKTAADEEWMVTIRVNQLPRAVQTRSVRQDLSVERQINILFVIDNSRSMAGEQKILAASFDRFIKGFLDQRLEFRIGVLTTDAGTVFRPERRRDPAVFGAGHLQLTAEALSQKQQLEAARPSGQPADEVRYRPFLDNRTPELTTRFEELVQVGISGSPDETAVVPILMSFVEKLSPGAIEHNTASVGEEPFFYQPEAFLSIVVVSDEDEAVSWIQPIQDDAGRVSGYEVEIGSAYLIRTRNGEEAAEQYIEGLLKALKSLKSGAGFRIDAVTHPRKGAFFSRLAELGGGRTADITRDFSEALIAIGESIARQASRTFRLPEFELDEVFFPGTIRVFIDGREVAEDPVDGWFFDPDRQTVELRGGAGEESFGAVVRIDFSVEYQP